MHWQYVIPGYLFVAVVLGTYTVALIRRGRQLSKQVPEGKRRFLDG